MKSTTFYNNQLEKYTKESKQLKAKLISFSLVRLAIFVLTIVAVYYTFSTWKLALAIGVSGLVVFLLLLSKYTTLQYKRAIAKSLIKINEDEIAIAKGDYYSRYNGEDYMNPTHQYSLDIDLFGHGSLFQYLNRTVLKEGSNALASALTANKIDAVCDRQIAIKELSEIAEWRQHFSAMATQIKTEAPTLSIASWLKGYKSVLPVYSLILGYLYCAISLLVLGGIILNYLDLSLLGSLLFGGLIITAFFLKGINTLAQKTDKVKDTFRQYSVLLKAIEDQVFISSLLKDKQQLITTNGEKASVLFKQFSKSLDALDNRNNLIGAIFGNGFFLTDIRNAYRVEKWIAANKTTVEQWFEVVSFFEAYNSLANFSFNHTDFTIPNIVDSSVTINAQNLGHPLLASEKRVNSNLQINTDGFFIVTGANMAGKSTFLRTVSLHIVMANVGLPVCATKSDYTPVKLITSMRTTDNLTDDSSYFFSELTRLKFIVDAIKTDRYFIILDEILKGTNSTDKAIGSKKFVEKLVASKASGIIATHDLSLCETANEIEQVQNYYFDAEIVNDELYFDYKLKKGICQNMNASFLLKKMEIV